MKFLCLFLSVITVAYMADFMHWSDIKRIRLSSSDVGSCQERQLKRVGGTAPGDVQLTSLLCSASDFNGTNIMWKCNATIGNNYRVTGLHVKCEHLNDETILDGSCHAEYNLNKVSDEVGIYICVILEQDNNGIFSDRYIECLYDSEDYSRRTPFKIECSGCDGSGRDTYKKNCNWRCYTNQVFGPFYDTVAVTIFGLLFLLSLWMTDKAGCVCNVANILLGISLALIVLLAGFLAILN